MITSVVNILIQGQLPVQADTFSKLAFSLSNTGSVIFIALNMLLCIQLIYRVTQFMYRRSEANLNHLAQAMEETKLMMGNIRGDAMSASYKMNGGEETMEGDGDENDDDEDVEDVNEDSEAKENEFDDIEGRRYPDYNNRKLGGDSTGINNNKGKGPAGGVKPAVRQQTSFVDAATAALRGLQPTATATAAAVTPTAGAAAAPGAATTNSRKNQNSTKGLKRRKSKRSRISTLTPAEIDSQWAQHEAEVHEYLHRRSAINERREMLRFGVVSFEKFWNKSCRDTGVLALIFFYAGTSLMLVASMVFFWNLFIHSYDNIYGAWVAIITIGLSLIMCLGFAVYLRFFDPSIQSLKVKDVYPEVTSSESFANLADITVGRDNDTSRKNA
mmetsp:Transcript_32362/g.54108  ORF Transcript_32362/g.54108 Transcript_32362/m.54108 type:complete len:386 (+) Transcript_32362:2-1159(+)